MKQCDELTYDEKVELLKDALDKWKRDEEPYKNLENKFHVADWCFMEYYKEFNNFELTNNKTQLSHHQLILSKNNL